jgi:hypothetical protein
MQTKQLPLAEISAGRIASSVGKKKLFIFYLFCHLTTFAIINLIMLRIIGLLVNNEFDRIWKEATIA